MRMSYNHDRTQQLRDLITHIQRGPVIVDKHSMLAMMKVYMAQSPNSLFLKNGLSNISTMHLSNDKVLIEKI